MPCICLRASRYQFLGRGPEFDALAEGVELASAEFVLEAVDDVSAVMNVLRVRRAVVRGGGRERDSPLLPWSRREGGGEGLGVTLPSLGRTEALTHWHDGTTDKHGFQTVLSGVLGWIPRAF